MQPKMHKPRGEAVGSAGVQSSKFKVQSAGVREFKVREFRSSKCRGSKVQELDSEDRKFYRY